MPDASSRRNCSNTTRGGEDGVAKQTARPSTAIDRRFGCRARHSQLQLIGHIPVVTGHRLRVVGLYLVIITNQVQPGRPTLRSAGYAAPVPGQADVLGREDLLSSQRRRAPEMSGHDLDTPPDARDPPGAAARIDSTMAASLRAARQ